jgi:hypothetical protein
MATLSVYSLPDFLFSKLNTDRIHIEENAGTFMIRPAKRTAGDFSSLRGILADGKSSVDEHLQRMREDLELELSLEE